jgi:hypothetical protein
MGTVGGSDDHRAQPGRRGGGYTAVLAKSLTRNDIIEAIRARRVYATTGDRVILDFKINGMPMGSVIDPSPAINVEILAEGTAPIKSIQLMRYDWQSNKWTAVIDENQSSTTARIENKLESTTPAVYYVRLEQKGLVSGRHVRAWSSPIWVGNPPGKNVQ